jgi:septal ring factor EnvC (AmiA/AmiB activator)
MNHPYQPQFSPSIFESSHPTIDPTFINPDIRMNTPVVINSLTLQRRKRAPYFYTGFFSAVTGLATQESIETIQKNEDNMKLVEEKTNKQLQLVHTQTNKVIENIREQASQLSKLYKEDSEIKTELKKIFNDENMTLKTPFCSCNHF